MVMQTIMPQLPLNPHVGMMMSVCKVAPVADAADAAAAASADAAAAASAAPVAAQPPRETIITEASIRCCMVADMACTSCMIVGEACALS